ncbi:hypothetical protein Trco_002711 [Trichoderma cornu-damae]|uniref:Uncharacterized protein n=1 Tax=Trichoderma cornu-damae TaxID=654480 RepID=A0A9P8QN73_9HYPO|nr:hypothetical protein Trco_002711 [Trichoderma cornu-damae]
MEFNTIFKIAPYPKDPSLGDIVIFPALWAFLSLVCLCTKMVTALWPSILSYLSFVLAFSPDKNSTVAVVSWLSLLRYWKPWAATTAGLRIDVDVAIDFFFLAWFLMAFPVIVLTIWVVLKGVLRLTANEIVRRIHDAMEFEFDLTEYLIKCYSPMEPGSTGDRVVAQLRTASGDRNFGLELPESQPLVGLNKAGYEAIFRGRRPRRFVTRSFTGEELRDQARFKKSVKERCAQIQAAKEVERIAAEQPVIDPTPTPSDSEQHASISEAAASVPQPRETATPVVQFSARPTDLESDTVAEDVTVASNPIETEEPADKKESKGEGLVGKPGPEASPEPEVSFEAEGNGTLEGAEDSPAEEPEFSSEKEGESSAEEPEPSYEEEGEGSAEEPKPSLEGEGEGPAEEPKPSLEGEGEGPAEEPKPSLEGEGEGSLYEVGPASDPEISLEVEGEAPSHATVPEAAQELETSFEEEGDGLLNIDAAPAEEPEVSLEAEGEGWAAMASVAESSLFDGLPDAGGNKNETSFEGEFDVDMAAVETLVDSPYPKDTILPLEVVAPRSFAGQQPGCHYDTREWLAVPDGAPASEGHQYDGFELQTGLSQVADIQTFLEEDYANMDPDLLDRQMDDLLAGTTEGILPTSFDSWFVEFEEWLGTLPDETVPVAASFIPAANFSEEDHMMDDVGRTPHALVSDSDDDLVVDTKSPVSKFFCPGIFRDSGLDEVMDLVGNDGTDTEVELLTAALAQLALVSVEDIDIIIVEEEQQPQEDVEMVALQKPMPPVIVVDMADVEDLVPPTNSTTELSEPIFPVIDMLNEFPVIDILNEPIFQLIDMTEPEEPTPIVDDIIPDAVPDSPQYGTSCPRTPCVGEDGGDWNEQESLPEVFAFPQTPTRAKPTSDSEDELSTVSSPPVAVSPGSSLLDELEAALLGMSPPQSRARWPPPDPEEAPLWAFPPDMVDSSNGAGTSLSLNEIFNLRQEIESYPTTQVAADRSSEENPAPTDVVPGPDSVTQAQEPTPEDRTQAGSSKSPNDDATPASGVVTEEQKPVAKPLVPGNIPTIVVTPEPKRTEGAYAAPIKLGGLILPGGNLIQPTTPKPKRTEEAYVAPIKMGGLILPGGNLVQPANPAPMTPLPQQAKTPDAEALRKQKEESLARDLRNVMRRRQPASLFHAKRPQKSSALILSPDAAERDRLLRSPQSILGLSRSVSDANSRVDAGDEEPPNVIIASPTVMRAVRESEARRGISREGNADEI